MIFIQQQETLLGRNTTKEAGLKSTRHLTAIRGDSFLGCYLPSDDAKSAY